MNPIFLGSIQKGKLTLNNPEGFDRWLIRLEGKSVEVVVRLPRKDRSNNQNRWYWRCVVGIPAEHFGYLPEEMHDCYKMMFLRMNEEGRPETIKSTTSLSTVEFSDFVEKCRQWAAERGMVIPDPESIVLS